MPRQAVRLVLGRGAKASSTTRLRPFSTTPRRRDDDPSKPTTRRDRSVAAASAIGAMSRPSDPSQQSQGSSATSARRPAIPRNPASLPHTATLGARLGANVISVRSLPNREDGARPLIRKVDIRDDSRGPQGFRSGQGGSGAVGSRFVPRPNGPRFARPPGFQGGKPTPRLRATLDTPLGGARRGPPRRTGGMKKNVRKESDEKKKEREKQAEQALGGLKSLDEEVQAYVREQQVGGPERQYKPSVTLESLVGWGPALATNTALGQADMAFRSVKVLGGGRGTSEEEQSFKIDDVRKWLVANKPIYFSNFEQKRAVIETLAHGKRDRMVQKLMDSIVEEIKKKNGDNWGSFVTAFKDWAAKLASSKNGKQLGENLIESNAGPEAWLKAFAEAQVAKSIDGQARTYKTHNTKTTKEAIQKYVLKGEHPEVKYAEDFYGKLAAYHALGSTYTAADGAKFDERLRKLIKVPAPAQAARPAQSTA